MRCHATIDDPDPGPAARSLASGKSSDEREEVASGGFVDMVEIDLQVRGNGARRRRAWRRTDLPEAPTASRCGCQAPVPVVGDDLKPDLGASSSEGCVGIDRDQDPSADRLAVPVILEIARMLPDQFS